MPSTKRRNLFSIFFVAAMDNFGFAIVFVMFAPLILTSEYHFLAADTSLGMRNFYLGLLFAVYPLTQLFGAPIIGDFADLAGRKKALYITLLGSVFSFFLTAIAVLFSSYLWLIISRLISGFFAGNLSLCLSSIADLSPTEKERGRNFGWLTVVWASSWTLAMITGGYLSDASIMPYFNPSLPFWVTGGLTFLAVLAIMKYFTETTEISAKARFDLIKGIRNIRNAIHMHSVRPFFLAILLWMIGWGVTVQWFASYGILNFQATQIDISWGLLFQGLFWMCGGLIINPFLVKRFSSIKVAIIGNALCTAFLIFCSIPNAYYFFAVLYWISAIFASFGFSNTLNLASINAPNNVQGKIMGLSQSMMSLAWIIVPGIGALIGTLSSRFFYPVGALLLFITTLLLILVKTKRAI